MNLGDQMNMIICLLNPPTKLDHGHLDQISRTALDDCVHCLPLGLGSKSVVRGGDVGEWASTSTACHRPPMFAGQSLSALDEGPHSWKERV
eukprot:CAMPEP_0196577228 /NCGR_PEP_ID=MMETSP1081-20130531/6337_1 /TAXON_ID=36882 /ORGANISM="Pyramimonas amylifera, Strain CCMP720" /LENGTH=90 /DNA_ID=CAMNT_0041896095 /DNA_START=74 /DNA_END=346 /DNA_ORIENTATION=+